MKATRHLSPAERERRHAERRRRKEYADAFKALWDLNRDRPTDGQWEPGEPFLQLDSMWGRHLSVLYDAGLPRDTMLHVLRDTLADAPSQGGTEVYAEFLRRANRALFEGFVPPAA